MITPNPLTPQTRLVLAIATLEFIQEQRVGSAETQAKVDLALASARQDLANLRAQRNEAPPNRAQPSQRRL
jgi:hypothetical protein